MKYNKYIVLYSSNFCARINDFFCLDEWITNGYDIEYWDLSRITCHEHLAEFSLEGLTIRVISSNKEYKELVKEYSGYKPLFLTWMDYSFKTATVFETITHYKCDYAFFDNGIIPYIKYNATRKWNVRKLILKIQAFYISLRSRTNVLDAPRYYFKLSEYITAGPVKLSPTTINGWCNSGDFEINNKIPKDSSADSIVFLDQYLPYHNDYKLQGDSSVDARVYFDSLNKCFRILERKYNKRVIIAAHPAAHNYRINNPYEGRRIIFNKTAELVKNSFGVIGHASTAISFAVLNYKPLVLFTTNQIIERLPSDQNYIETFRTTLGVPLYNADNCTDLSFEEVNKIKYDAYRYSYLTNHYSENQTNFNNIISILVAQKG